MSRHRIYAEPMTNAERQRRHRERRKAEDESLRHAATVDSVLPYMKLIQSILAKLSKSDREKLATMARVLEQMLESPTEGKCNS